MITVPAVRRNESPWSKALNNVGEFFFSSPIDPTNLWRDYGRSDDDQRHRVTVNGAVRTSTAAGRGAWTSAWKFDKEDKELEHQLVLDGVRTFDDLLAEPPRADEVWDDAADATRMGRYAVRLWRGLLASEEKSDQ